MIRDVGLLWVGQAATKVLAFVAFAFLARVLETADYGAVEFAMGLAAFATVLIDAGLGTVGIRRLAQEGTSPARLAAHVAGAQMGLVAVVVPLACGCALLFAPDSRTVLLSCIVAASLVPLPWRQDWLFQATGQVAWSVVAQVVRGATFAVLVVLFVGHRPSLNLVGVFEVIAAVVAAAYLTRQQARRIGPPRLACNRGELRRLVHEAMPIGAAGVVWGFIHYTPLLLVGAVGGVIEAAHLGAAQRLAITLVSFSFAYHVAFFPALVQRIEADPEAAGRVSLASFRVAAWFGIAVGLALTLLAEPVLALVYGEKYGAAAPLLRCLAWIFPVTLLSGHVRWQLVALREARLMLVAQVTGAVLVVVAGPLLVWGFGARGAAAAMLLACLAIWGAAHRFARARRIAAPIAPAVRPALVAGVLLLLAGVVPLGPWIACLAGMLAYAGGALLLDRQLIPDLRWMLQLRSERAVAAGAAEGS